MEPNKFENQIKEKLNSRKIQPSAQAWDRLDAMLTVAENKKPKRNYWLYIAASIVVFVGVFLFNQENPKNKNNVTNQTVVITDAPQSKSSEMPEMKQSSSEIVTSSESSDERYAQTDETIKKRTVISENQNQESVTYAKKRKGAIKTKQEKVQDFVKIPQISKEMVAENESPKTGEKANVESNTTVLVAIENGNANNVLNEEKSLPKKSKIKINPNALLSQVDGELDLTFREKVIKNYKAVKVAVVNRNQE